MAAECFLFRYSSTPTPSPDLRHMFSSFSHNAPSNLACGCDDMDIVMDMDCLDEWSPWLSTARPLAFLELTCETDGLDTRVAADGVLYAVEVRLEGATEVRLLSACGSWDESTNV